jgi:outer membrane protein assembly factor BamB
MAILGAAFLTTTAVSARAAAGDWSHPWGDASRSYSNRHETRLGVDEARTLEEVWSKTFRRPTVYSPVVTRRAAYTFVNDREYENQRFVRIDLPGGDVRYDMDSWCPGYGPTVAAGMLLLSDSACSVSDPNPIRVHRAADGLWAWDSVGSYSGVVHRGVAFLTDGGSAYDDQFHLRAFDVRTGDLLWQLGPEEEERFSYATALGSRVFVRHGEGTVLALDARTGDELWRYEEDACLRILGAAEGNLYVTFERGAGLDFEAGVYAVRAGSGRIRWERRNDVDGFSALGRDVVLISESVLGVVDARSGALRWQRYGRWGTPTTANGVLYAFDGVVDDIQVFALATGEELGRIETGSRAVVAHGRVYTGSGGHRLIAYA